MGKNNPLKRERRYSDSSQSSNEGDKREKNTDRKKIRADDFQWQHIDNLSEKEAENARLRQIIEQHRLQALTNWLKSNQKEYPNISEAEAYEHAYPTIPHEGVDEMDVDKKDEMDID